MRVHDQNTQKPKHAIKTTSNDSPQWQAVSCSKSGNSSSSRLPHTHMSATLETLQENVICSFMQLYKAPVFKETRALWKLLQQYIPHSEHGDMLRKKRIKTDKNAQKKTKTDKKKRKTGTSGQQQKWKVDTLIRIDVKNRFKWIVFIYLIYLKKYQFTTFLMSLKKYKSMLKFHTCHK